MNFAKYETLKKLILSKMIFSNCKFCQKRDFEIVNFVKSEILKQYYIFAPVWKKPNVSQKTSSVMRVVLAWQQKIPNSIKLNCKVADGGENKLTC